MVPSLCLIILNFSHERNQGLLAFICPFFSATRYLPWVVFKATVRTRLTRLRTRLTDLRTRLTRMDDTLSFQFFRPIR